jgi:LmbE family N-acetylglucosaminyl deacetylase
VKNSRVLVLGGHLDDSIIAVGGIIKKMINAGCQVSVVCFGNGNEGFAHIEDQNTCVKKFTREAVKAHKILGVSDFVCHNYPDFGVQMSKETYRLCIEAIRRVKPDIIFGHYFREYFQHHAMAKLTTDAWYQAGWECSADLGKPHQAKRLYHYEVLQLLPDPTHLVDISDTLQDKLKAWDCFVTGKEHLGSLRSQIEARARYYGSLIGVKYAEALIQSHFMQEKIINPITEL